VKFDAEPAEFKAFKDDEVGGHGQNILAWIEIDCTKLSFGCEQFLMDARERRR